MNHLQKFLSSDCHYNAYISIYICILQGKSHASFHVSYTCVLPFQKSRRIRLVVHGAPFGADDESPNEREARLAEESEQPRGSIVVLELEQAITEKTKEKQQYEDFNCSLRMILNAHSFVWRNGSEVFGHCTSGFARTY